MKKGLLITAGIIIIFSLVAVWIYLMLYGTPKNSGEIFSNLGFTGGGERGEVIDYSDENTLVEVGDKPLQQLTTRPVAGSQLIIGDDKNWVRYVEKGTGYIFQIDLATGEEIQITNTTIPLTNEVRFSPDGAKVLYTNYIEGEQINFISVLDVASGTTDFIENIPLPPNSDNLVFKDADNLLYTLSEADKTTGYSFNLTNRVRTELFNVPLRQVSVVWGEGRDKIYLYPKTAAELEGFVYQINNNKLTPATPSGHLGLSFGANDVVYFETYIQDNKLTSVLNATDNPYTPGTILIPDKCAFADADIAVFVCATPNDIARKSFINDWYKGIINSSDKLILINPAGEYYDVFANLSEASGRQIDAMQLHTSPSGQVTIFTNKIDNTLWLYDATLLTNS